MKLIAKLNKEDIIKEFMDKLIRDLEAEKLYFTEFINNNPRILFSHGISHDLFRNYNFNIELWCLNDNSPIITSNIDIFIKDTSGEKVLQRKPLVCVPLKWRAGSGTITIVREKDFSSEEVKVVMEVAKELSASLDDYYHFRYTLIASSLHDLMEKLITEKPRSNTPLHWASLLEAVIKDLLKRFGYPKEMYESLKLSIALFYPFEEFKGTLPCKIDNAHLLKRRCVALTSNNIRQYRIQCALSGSKERKICVPLIYGGFKVGIANLQLANESSLDSEVLEDIIVFLRYYAASELIGLYHAFLKADEFLGSLLEKIADDKVRGIEDVLRDLGEFLGRVMPGVDDIFIYKYDPSGDHELIFQGSSPRGISFQSHKTPDPHSELKTIGRSAAVETSVISFDFPVFDEEGRLIAFITLVDKSGGDELDLPKKVMLLRLMKGLRWIAGTVKILRNLDRDLYQLKRTLKTEVSKYRRVAREWERRARELERKIGSLEAKFHRKEFIYNLSKKLTGTVASLSWDEVFNWVVRSLPEVLNFSADMVSIFIWWPLKGSMELVAQRGLTQDVEEEIKRRLSYVEEDELKEAMLSQGPFIPSSDSQTFRLFPEFGRYKTVLVAPMVASSSLLKFEGGVQGALILASRHSYKMEDVKEDTEFLHFVAELLGTYLEIFKLNRFSYKLSTAYSLVTEYLAKFSREYIKNRDFSYYANLMLDIIYQVMTPYWLAYTTLEDGTMRFKLSMVADDLPELRFKREQKLPGFLVEKLKQGKIIINVALDHILEDLPEDSWTHQGAILVPLMTSKGLRGAIWVMLRGVAVTEADLKLLTFLQQAINISFENFSLYQEINEYKNLLEATFKSISDGFIVLDLDKRIAFINPVAENILKLDSSALGKSILEMFPYRYISLFRKLEELDELIHKKEERFQGEDTIYLPNGRTLYVNYTINLIRDNGQLKGYIITIRDITRQKEIEQERNDMIALLSHDIRNPLTAVSGYISLLLKRSDSLSEEDKKRFVLMAKRELDRMTRMLNNLIDLVKLETGGLKINITDLNLTEMVRYYVETYRFISTMHEFKAELPQKEIWVKADKEVLQQVLDNLLSNAVKYSPSGGTITIGAEVNEEKGEVTVYVKDQGLGIPEDQLKNLFKKYSRIKTENRKGIRGTGLGLYITKKLIEQLGGTIWVKSKEGKGSTFFFTLKLSHKSLREEKKPIEKVKQES